MSLSASLASHGLDQPVRYMSADPTFPDLRPEFRELQLVVLRHFTVGGLEHRVLQQRGHTWLGRDCVGLLHHGDEVVIVSGSFTDDRLQQC
jgi:hypothetical protein